MEHFLTLKGYKNAKITERLHAYEGYTSNYIVEILSASNPGLQLKDADSTINKFIVWIGRVQIHGNISFKVWENKKWWWDWNFLFKLKCRSNYEWERYR